MASDDAPSSPGSSSAPLANEQPFTLYDYPSQSDSGSSTLGSPRDSRPRQGHAFSSPLHFDHDDDDLLDLSFVNDPTQLQSPFVPYNEQQKPPNKFQAALARSRQASSVLNDFQSIFNEPADQRPFKSGSLFTAAPALTASLYSMTAEDDGDGEMDMDIEKRGDDGEVSSSSSLQAATSTTAPSAQPAVQPTGAPVEPPAPSPSSPFVAPPVEPPSEYLATQPATVPVEPPAFSPPSPFVAPPVAPPA